MAAHLATLFFLMKEVKVPFRGCIKAMRDMVLDVIKSLKTSCRSPSLLWLPHQDMGA